MIPTDTSGPYVLIADFPGASADSLSAFAREASLDPVLVTDGEAAVTLLETRGLPQLLIVNPTLPKLDGFAVIRELRERATPDQVPVLVTSAFLTLRTHATRMRESLGIAAVLSPQLGVARAHEIFLKAIGEIPPIVTIDLEDPNSPCVREAARLAELEELRLVRTDCSEVVSETELEAIAHQFGVSTVLITVVSQDRVLFKAQYGLRGALLAGGGAPRETSFCRHVVDAVPPSPLVVPDATAHPAFADNPWVRAGVVGSYVGVPLTTSSGNVLGTLCLIDEMPWLGSAALVHALTARASLVTDRLLARCNPPAHVRQHGPSSTLPPSPAQP